MSRCLYELSLFANFSLFITSIYNFFVSGSEEQALRRCANCLLDLLESVGLAEFPNFYTGDHLT